MTDREPAEVTNLDRYGNPELPWSRARDAARPAGAFDDLRLSRNAAARAALMATLAGKAPASP
jgi:hypothetical protein